MEARINTDSIRLHLSLLFEDAVTEHRLFFCIFCIPSRSARFFNEIDSAVSWCEKQAEAKEHVYVGMGLYERPISHGRGTAADVKAIVGLWSDVDILNPLAHKAKDYPVSVEEALSIATVGGFKPSVTVNSGYGLHTYHLFKEPLIFENPSQHNDASVLLSRWAGTVQSNARARGKVVDSVHDLARVLRVAGTLNWKDPENPRAVTIDASPVVRYNPDDIEPFLIAAEYVKQGAEIIGEVSNFTINPTVGIARGFVSAMTANNEELAKTWRMERTDFKDPSPSSYDMSLCGSFIKMDFDDQQIVDLLVYWRREIAKAPKNRVDYYQRTIGKCRTSQQSDEAIKMFDQPGEMPQTSDPSLLTSNDRTKLLNGIRGALMINVAKFVQLNKDNAEYFVHLDNGEHFSVGRVASITRFHIFRDRVLERCNVMIPSDRAERWSKIVIALFSIIEKEETEDPRTQDRVLGYITDYLEHVKIFQEEEWQSALAEDYPMIKDGKVWVNKRHFIRWCNASRGNKITETDAERDFHLLNMERKRHEGCIKNKVRRPWFWGLPADDFNNILSTKRKPQQKADK